MAIIKEWRGIRSDLGTNQNKFWNCELHSDGRVVSKWGRVGDVGRETPLGHGEATFDAKCREKGKKGYIEQRIISSLSATQNRVLSATNLEQVATEQIAANSADAAALIRKLVKANVHTILESTTLRYDANSGLFSTPLGIVTQDAIAEARGALSTIVKAVANGTYGDPHLERAANRYLNLVPQNIGRSRKTLRDLYPDAKAVQQQSDLLDRLETSLQMALINPSSSQSSNQPRVFEASLHLVEGRDEFRELNAKFKSTLNRSHVCSHLKLLRVYTVEIAAMKKAFELRSQSINNVMELWHGTGTGNILSILKDGFRIKPPTTAAITGKMFGEGAYFALQSSKSLNYAHGFWNGTRNTNCFMFLCSVAVGRYQVPSGTTSQRPRRGLDSYWAKPGQTAGIVNDEIVVFDEAQINIRYLLEFSE